MKLTILTVTYNCDNSLPETLASIKGVSDVIEHIFVDGKSSDKTLKIINDYCSSSQLSTKIVSESDKGIYDALNKGTRLAKGEYILVLHAGDQLLLSITEVLNLIESDFDIMAFSGQFVKKDLTISEWERDNFRLTLNNPAIRHPTLIISKKLLMQFDGYDLQYKISADFDFICRVIKYGNPVIINRKEVLLKMEEFGFSGSQRHFLKKKLEHYKIAKLIDNKFERYTFQLRLVKQVIFTWISFAIK